MKQQRPATSANRNWADCSCRVGWEQGKPLQVKGKADFARAADNIDTMAYPPSLVANAFIKNGAAAFRSDT